MRWSSWVSISAPPAGRIAGALDDQIVALDRDAHAAAGEPGGDGREPVAFLDAQLGEPAHDRAPSGAGRGDGEDRIFVDHPRRPLGGNVGAGQRAGADTDVGHRLAALLALVQQRDVGAHLAQAFEKAGAQRVDADAFDGHVGARHDQRGDQRKGRRGRIARHDDRRRREFGIALDGDPAPAAFLGLGRHRGAEMAQHPLGVVARRLRLDHRGRPRRVEAGEQHRGFDLRRGHRQAVADRDRIGGAADGERQAAAFAASRNARRCGSAARRRGPSAGAAARRRR